MTHQEKVAHLLRDLGERGIRPLTVAPPLYRQLWRLGINVRPPHFASFWWIALVNGSVFAVFLGALNAVVRLWLGRPQAWSWSYLIIDLAGVAVVSAIIGVYGATYYRRQARELGLPRWEDYPAA